MSSSAYIKEVRANLPRILSLVDRDITSDSYGMADRYHWAWGLIDFGNGTFQGMANGLARLWVNGLWPYPTSSSEFLKRIDSLFIGASKLTRKDGSLEEAFPNEGSFCVTALVAYDLLVALDLLQRSIDDHQRKRWEDVIRPMIGYLINASETHAVISNHLSTAIAALVRWELLTADIQANNKYRELLNYLLKQQSSEGWFREYQGADPGYQSLCTCYLADIHLLCPDLQLLEPLRKSIQFLWHFAHPDGSFGGVYGSRCTRFYYPSGILALANEIPEAAALAEFMEKSISTQSVVTLSSIDEPNLAPFFNSYCWAASMVVQNKQTVKMNFLPSLPSICSDPLRLIFNQAGIIIDRGPGYYSIIGVGKGGVVYHFVEGRKTLINAGVVVTNKNGDIGSSQTPSNFDLNLTDDTLKVFSPISQMPKKLPNPWQFVVIRLLGITLFRSTNLREWIKQILVRFLITGVKFWPVSNMRFVKLGKNLIIKDEVMLKPGYQRVDVGSCEFVGIHMASQGYWQIQDEERY